MKKQTAGRDVLGDLAPEFAHLNDDVLFGEVWAREERLSPKARSMITIAALMSQGSYPQVKAHLAIGKEHGITKDEAVEIVTHLAFYCGWSRAWSVFPLIQEVYGDNHTEAHGGLFGMGEENTAYAKYFIGKSYLKVIAADKTIPSSVCNVTFEPGCRNNWHIHKSSSGGGQILICVEGAGWYQEEGKDAIRMTPGSVVIIPPNVKHWHGAAKDSWFSHLAIELPGADTSNEWLEPVDEAQYGALGER